MTGRKIALVSKPRQVSPFTVSELMLTVQPLLDAVENCISPFKSGVYLSRTRA